MSSPQDDLIDFVVNSGLTREEAEHAVRICTLTMVRNGWVAGSASAAIAFFMTKNPIASLSTGVIGAGAGAAYTVVAAPQCQEVRDAVRYWSRAAF